MRRIALSVLLALGLVPCWASAQVVVPAEAELGQPIVCTVNLQGVPEGAELKGAVQPDVPGAEWLPGAAPNEFHIWAKPGKYDIEVMGMWGIRDPEKPTSWLDFGFFRYKAKFVVKGGDDPVPPQPEPLPGGPYQVMLFYSESQIDNLPQPQRDMLTSLVFRDWLSSQGHVLQEVGDPANFNAGRVPERWKPWLKAVEGDPLPRIALASKDGGPIKDYALPDTLDGVKALLAKAGSR
jgi:hypothetical protein